MNARRNTATAINGTRPYKHRPRAVSIGLLGPFQVTVNEIPVPLTAGRLRTVLALLALSVGQVVTVERLAVALWADGHRPHNARRSIQTYLSRLRGLLGPDMIGSASTGYVLYAAPEHVDTLYFSQLVTTASAASTATAERKQLSEALSLWRGDPFDGVPSAWLIETEKNWLIERYLTVLERRIDLDLAAGAHRELAVELTGLAARYPLREPLWMRMLIALHRSGRRADALTQYEVIRSRVATELGVDPDPSLQRIHADLLAEKKP